MEGLDYEYKKCEYCGEEIGLGLKRCPYCGSLLKIDADEYKPAFPIEIQGLDIDTSNNFENQPDMQNQVDMPVNIGFPGDNTPETNFAATDAGISAVKAPTESQEGNTHRIMSNGLKVFIATACAVIPGLGQLIGIIISIVLLNSDESDKKSFGFSLLVSSLLMFAIAMTLLFFMGAVISAYFM